MIIWGSWLISENANILFFSHNINIHFQAISFLVSNFSQNSGKKHK
jgi:hypothetical protein